MKRIICLLLLLSITLGISAQNNEQKFNGWKKAETLHFNFIYEDAQKEAAEGFIKIADDAWNNVAKIYAFPQDRTNVYITGRTNTVNAFTFFAPTEIMMFTNPCTLIDFTFRDNWQKLFFTHELIHVANMRFEDRNQTLQKLFGPAMISLDFTNVNGWALEGLTTVLETELTDGGRGRSPFFELDYKAPTLDNGFIAYEDIGLETEPPRGQSYVMGYLIMKSIADRYGLNALADIERNRKSMGSWEDSVKLVTGEYAQDIYRDVRIALAKKYADERKIPEGIFISPRAVNTSYYDPAIIFDDGSFITLRTADGKSSAVKFNPSFKKGSRYIQNTKPEKDLNTVSSETVLFTDSFMDEYSLTADENETLYASIGITRNDRNPGMELESAIHKWTKKDGLKRLTKNISLFQPSVSRNGKLLVAVQQKGMQMQLVKIDTETGDVSELLSSPSLSFLYPSVNSDGTKITFLVLDDTRARIAVMETDNPSAYRIIANDDEKIFDPAKPVWNSNGRITYCSNNRGRLEAYEIDEDGNSVPMLSDPIGITWAYVHEKGVYYSSVASSGRVIKMKPVQEWGTPADFEGPSMPGEKICFGHLENDYPEFKPFTLLSEIEVPEEESAGYQQKNSLVKEKKNKGNDSEEKPVPVKGKYVKHRSEENVKKAEEANETITEIQNEKNFIAFPQPLFYLPLFDFLEDSINQTIYSGYGYFGLFSLPKLQNSTGLIITELLFYPEIMNFNGSIDCLIPVGSAELDLYTLRTLSITGNDLPYTETTTLQAVFALPLFNRHHYTDEMKFSLLSNYSFDYIRRNASSLSLTETSASSFEFVSNGALGFQLYSSKNLQQNQSNILELNALALARYDHIKSDLRFGFEAEVDYLFATDLAKIESLLKTRYTPFPADTILTESYVKYAGNTLDCSKPFVLVPQIAYSLTLGGMVDFKLYSEMLFYIDLNNPAEILGMDESLAFGNEFVMRSSDIYFAAGIAFKLPLDERTVEDEMMLYLTIKYNGYRR